MITFFSSAIATASASRVESSSVEGKRHNILAELNYWKDDRSRSVLMDFNMPRAQERYNDPLKPNQAHSVTVHDIRGEESKYTLTLFHAYFVREMRFFVV
jgi:hypothetical protein